MTRLWKLFAVVASALAWAALAAVPGARAIEPQSKVRAAFVYVSPVGDAGWTFAHDRARKETEKALSFVETAYTETVPEGAEAERVINQYARRGYNLIFTTSFGYMDPTINVAKRFPNVVFMHCSGFKTAKNVGTYFGRIYQPRYLTGIVAGRMTKTNIIGYVAAHPIPEVIRGINAFTLGVRSVNPGAKVHVVWTQTWYDPAKEREAAESLLDINADVIAQHQDSPGPQQAAEKRGRYSVGYNSDMSAFAPKAHLTAPVWNWAVIYKKVAQEVHDGTWKSYQYWGGLKDGVVDIAPFGSMVPQDVRDLVNRKKGDLIAGKFDVFEGPLKDQSSRTRLAAGKRMSDPDMLSMNFFVEGVVGQIPK